MSGEDLEKKAYHKQKSTNSVFSLFFDFLIDVSPDSSAELFNQAGNLYLLEKNNKKAVECYIKAYEEYNKLGTYNHYAMKNLSLAVTHGKENNMFSTKKLIEMITILADNYGKHGNMREHNEKYVEISLIYEKKNDLKNAILVLEKCVNTLNSSYDEIVTRKGELLINDSKYIEAGICFEELANNICARDKKISSVISSRQPYAMSLLCMLAAEDQVRANNLYLQISSFDQNFDLDSLGKLAKSVMTSINDQSIYNFKQSCKDYDKTTKLKSVHIKLLTEIQKKFQFEDINKNTQNDYDENDYC